MNTKKILLFLFLMLCSFRGGSSTAFASIVPFTQNGIVYNIAHTPDYGTSFKNLLEVVGFVSNELVDPTTVTIPKTVEINGENYTVYGVCLSHKHDVCSTITTIKLPESVTYFRLYNDYLDTHSFTNQSNQEVKYYDHSKGVVELPNLEYFVVDPKNTSLKEWQNKLLLSHDGTKLICCPPAAKSGNVVFNTIKSFGPYAFFGCGLTKLVIPASLETIDETAFCGFSGLAEFLNADYYKSGSAATNKKFVAKDGVLFEMYRDDKGDYTTYKSLLCFPDNKDTGSKLTYSLDGGGSLLYIAPYAFDDVKGTTTLNIRNCNGAGISINKYAFQNSSICFVNFGSVFVNRIGSYAFANTELVKLDLGKHAFNGGKLCNIEGYAFYNSSIKQIVWPTNNPHEYMSIRLEDYAMANCPSLIRVNFPKYTSNPGAVLTPLGKYAFYNCPSLESVDFTGATPGAGNYGVLPEGLFKDCKGLKNVTFDDNKITEIGDFAFSNCNLQSWVFNKQSASLKTIGKYAFAPTIGTYNNFNDTFTLEGFSALTTIGDGAFIKCNISTSDIHFYTATGGSTSVLKTIGAFAFNSNTFKKITIPEGVTEIGKFAFQGNNTLETIILPKTLEKFEWADVRSPFDLEAYGNGYETYSFRFGCRNLSRIVLRNGTNYEASNCGLLYDKRTMELIHCPENYKYTTTMGYQFMNVKGLVVENEVKGIKSLGPYCFDNSLMEIVVLPTTLQKIGAGAFRHAAVKSLTIPAKVTSVGSYLLGGGSTTAANIDLFMMPLKAPTITSVPVNAGEHTYLGISCNLYVKKTSFDKNYYGEEWTRDMKYYGYKIPIPITEKNRFFSICRDFDAEFGGTNLGAFIIKGYKGKPNSVIGTSLDCYVPSRIGAKQDKYVGAIVQLYKVKGDQNYVKDGNWYRIGERDFSFETQEKKADILGSEGEKNWLVGCPIPTYVNEVETKYALKYKKELGVSRFAQYISNGVVPMNKAYLDLNDHPYVGSSAAKELSLVFEDESETTGIEDSPIVDVDAQQNVARSPYYTLNGTKVDRPTAKGIYIHNGKKIVIR